jgi:hypothetical protein
MAASVFTWYAFRLINLNIIFRSTLKVANYSSAGDLMVYISVVAGLVVE